MYSIALIEVHFWLASIGILLYITAMWVSGITQGLMWRTYDENGFLLYTFSDTVAMLHPYYVTRFLGGVLYLSGVVVMMVNLFRTITGPLQARTPTPLVSGPNAADLTPAE
jgi:cytochrome c oxidase cbb3-type subunit 1